MFLVCRIFDGVTDLVMGGIVDKTSSRLGKARPWLIASAPLTLLGIVLLMNVPAGLGETGKLVYAYITYIFMNCIVYTIYGVSNTALLPLMTHDKNESTMLATFSALGNNMIGLLAGLLNKEMESIEEGRQRASVPMSEQLPGILILFLMPAISKKWNKKTFLLMGAVLIIAGFAITGLAGENTTMIVVGTVIRSERHSLSDLKSELA